ncbi:hypothetical protein ERJ75_001809100 [Trypanosoma vivax]|nr:hypothetical protein ERJ75_001809100 [Trypanosoma vivax]
MSRVEIATARRFNQGEEDRGGTQPPRAVLTNRRRRGRAKAGARVGGCRAGRFGAEVFAQNGELSDANGCPNAETWCKCGKQGKTSRGAVVHGRGKARPKEALKRPQREAYNTVRVRVTSTTGVRKVGERKTKRSISTESNAHVRRQERPQSANGTGMRRAWKRASKIEENERLECWVDSWASAAAGDAPKEECRSGDGKGKRTLVQRRWVTCFFFCTRRKNAKKDE